MSALAAFLLGLLAGLTAAAAASLWIHRRRLALADATARAAGRAEIEPELARLLAQRQALDDRLAEIQRRFEATGADLRHAQSAGAAAEADARAAIARLESTLDAERRRLHELGERAGAHEQRVAQLSAELARVGQQAASLLAERDAERAAHAQTRRFLEEAEGRLKSAFLEAASKVFDEKSLSLEQRIRESGEQSRKSLEETLKPFSERVGEFQSRVEGFVVEQAKGFAKFDGSFESVQKLNLEMAEATRSLAGALKGNAKTRGDWGEMILETVLKASGLVEGANYVRQPASEDEDSGRRRHPDVVVQLPDDRRIVVDSKVSLVAWTEANNAATPEQYEDAMLRHTASIRQHVRDLEAKNYPRVVGPEAIDFTVMFVPIEGALSAALSYNADLQVEAFRRRIVLASPNTLMAILRVVEQLWTRDRLQRTVEKIGTDAGRVLDALIDFLGEFEEVNKHIGRASDAFGKAKNRLTESPQSVVNRTRRLVEAGAKGKKAIPDILQPEEGLEVAAVLGLDRPAEAAETNDGAGDTIDRADA